MDLQGKVIFALDPKTGQSARGEWKVQEYVIETHEAYPHKMVFSVFGEDRIQRFNIHEGQEVMVSFDIDAHEYNGHWLTLLHLESSVLLRYLQVKTIIMLRDKVPARCRHHKLMKVKLRMQMPLLQTTALKMIYPFNKA
jgi:hypothetical protein